MKKYYLFAAVAAAALASCSNDDFVGDVGNRYTTDPVEAPIVFTSNQKAFTRADDFTGAEAAKKLGNKFVVSGYKGAQTTWNDASNSIVFDNYFVEYAENTANTTESNSANWEYVGKTPIAHATTNGITSQTIKYWDYSKDQYDFFAWSTGSKTPTYTGSMPSAGSVDVTAMTYKTATGTSGTAYTFQGAAADLAECYISDLVTVKKAGKGTGDTYGVATDGYGKPVTLKFRQLGTKVRLGIYETVPGYSVKDVKFYTAPATALATNGDEKKGTLFTTTDGAIRTAGTYTVYFPTVDAATNADNNQAHITFAAAASSGQTTLENGTLTQNYTIAESGEKTPGAVFLGRTSNTATFAGEADDNYYKIFLPNETGANLNLRVNYTLESIDGSGEIIEVKGATAQVPIIYAKWLPGYAYTYLFKISDKTNGYTGVYDPTNPNGNTTDSNPAGLYPITFDAVVVNAEKGNTQETITTVSAPSITTYQKGSTVVNSNEYVAATGDIYVTVNDAPSASPDLPNGVLQTLTGKAALYTVVAGTTEAQVVDALQMQDDDHATGTIKGRNGLVLTIAKSGEDNLLSLTNSVNFGVDGNAISVGTDQAAKFTPVTGTTYAFVYTKTAATANNDAPKYQALAFASFATGATKYRYAYKDATANQDVQEGVLYFPDETSGKKDVFLGQTVNNLYADQNGTAASGYAKTGTTYYYTTDGGQHYTAAHPVPYASSNWLNGLYEEDSSDATGYKITTDTEPASGKAYYYRTGSGTTESPYVHTYCVFMPERTNGLKVLDKDTYVKATETSAVGGMTYFDQYIVNDGVYYAKVIKVQ